MAKKEEKSEVAAKAAEDSMQRIVALMRARDQLQYELEEAEAHVRIKRKGVEKANAMVFCAIREESQPSLFSAGVTVSDADVAAATAEIAKPEKEAEPAGPTSETWRLAPIADLKLAKPAAKALAERKLDGAAKSILTVGTLYDVIESKEDLAKTCGLKPAAVKAIDKALQAFLAKAAK